MSVQSKLRSERNQDSKTLNSDTLTSIFSNLSPEDLKISALVCKAWEKISNNNLIWFSCYTKLAYKAENAIIFDKGIKYKYLCNRIAAGIFDLTGFVTHPNLLCCKLMFSNKNEKTTEELSFFLKEMDKDEYKALQVENSQYQKLIQSTPFWFQTLKLSITGSIKLITPFIISYLINLYFASDKTVLIERGGRIFFYITTRLVAVLAVIIFGIFLIEKYWSPSGDEDPLKCKAASIISSYRISRLLDKTEKIEKYLEEITRSTVNQKEVYQLALVRNELKYTAESFQNQLLFQLARTYHH